MGVCWYDPALARFVSVDPHPGDQDDGLSQNEYIYCRNNPINFTDPDGDYIETALDVASVVYSANEFKKNRSWGNAGYLAFDTAMVIVPLVPAIGIARAGIKAGKGGKIAKNAAKGKAFESKVLKANKLVKNTKNVGGTIPDSLSHGVNEIKNVNKQSLTNQIKKQIAYAKSTKQSYTLHIAKRTKLSAPLKRELKNIKAKIKRY